MKTVLSHLVCVQRAETLFQALSKRASRTIPNNCVTNQSHIFAPDVLPFARPVSVGDDRAMRTVTDSCTLPGLALLKL